MTTEPLYLSCHCQKHVLQIIQDEGKGVADLMKDAKTDDCSICIKRRPIWYHLSNPNVKIEIIKGFGKDGVELQGYSFGTKRLAHQSCDHCGTLVSAQWISPSPKAGDLYMLNMRALRDPELHLDDYTFLIQDTSRDDPQYTHVEVKDIPGAVEYLTARKKVYKYDTEIYAGSCHCQAVKFAVLCKPMEEVYILDCTCSICRGNGHFWTYPGRRNVYFERKRGPDMPWSPDESLTQGYTWGDYMLELWLCKTCKCGVYWSSGPDEDPVADKALDPEEEDKEKEKERVGGDMNYGWNKWLGLNGALLTKINDYVGDVHNTHPEGSERDAPKGMKGRSTNQMGFEDPIYRVKL